MSKVAVDIRRQKSASAKTIAANKDRLKALASTIEAELEGELLGLGSGAAGAPVGSLGGGGAYSASASLGGSRSSSTRLTQQEMNWKHSLLGCGSNAFSQLSLDNELMSCALLHLPLHSHVGGGGDTSAAMGSGISNLAKYSSAKKSKINGTASGSGGGGGGADNAAENGPMQITCLASSANVSAAVIDGCAYMWGEAFGGPLLRVPTPVGRSARNVVSISCGDRHAGLITVIGACYTWGHNDHGMLGHGAAPSGSSNGSSSTGSGLVGLLKEPTRVEAFINMHVSAVSCGGGHSAFIACSPSELVHTPIPEGDYMDVLTGGSLYTCGRCTARCSTHATITHAGTSARSIPVLTTD